MVKDNQQEMDRLRADTDIAGQCGSEKEGRPNPLIPPHSSCDVVEPMDPKKPPQAQGTDIANVDGLTEAEQRARAAMRKPGRDKPGRENRANAAFDKVEEEAEAFKEKATQIGEGIKERAADFGEDIAEKYKDATASVDEQNHQDSFTFAEHVVEKIAGIAAREITGILALKGSFISNVTRGIMDNNDDPTRGVSVEVGEKTAVVSLKIIVEYGAPAPEIFKELRRHIAQQLAVMTGLTLAELNVEVVDVMTREEFQQMMQRSFNPFDNEASRYINRYQNNVEADNHSARNRAPQGRPQDGFGF